MISFEQEELAMPICPSNDTIKTVNRKRIWAVLCRFTFVNLRTSRRLTDLPCRKWLQNICIKLQRYLRVAISETFKDCLHFMAMRVCTVLLGWQIRKHWGEILSSVKGPVSHLQLRRWNPMCFYFIEHWCIPIRSAAAYQSWFWSIKKYRNAHMWRGFIMGDKQLRGFRMSWQYDLRSEHHGQLFKSGVRYVQI